MLLSEHLPVFLHDPVQAIAQVQAADCAVAYVDAPHRPAFEQGMADRAFEPLGRFEGFSIGGADEVDITGYLFR